MTGLTTMRWRACALHQHTWEGRPCDWDDEVVGNELEFVPMMLSMSDVGDLVGYELKFVTGKMLGKLVWMENSALVSVDAPHVTAG